jgi:hypothetical protein
MLALNFASMEEAPACIFVKGADASKAFKYTGVTPQEYMENAVGDGRFEELISPVFGEGSFVVGYQVERFLKPWLNTKFPDLFAQTEFLDVMDLAASRDINTGYPPGATSIKDFYEKIQLGLHCAGATHGYGYDLNSLAHRYLPSGAVETRYNPLRNKIINLWRVWSEMLEV